MRAATDAQAWRQGADLAIELLEEASENAEACMLDGEGRSTAVPQHNFVGRYLRTVREIGDTRIEAAFGAVLSDYIASCQDGGVPDVKLLRRLSRRPVANAPEVRS